MTPTQRNIYRDLLAGAYIMNVHHPVEGRKKKLYIGNMIPLRWMSPTSMKFLDGFLRWGDKQKTRQVLDRQAIRRLHGKTTFKTLYKQHLHEHRKMGRESGK